MQLSLIPAIFMFYGILSIAYSVTLLFYFSKQNNRAIENCAIGAFLMGISVIVTVFRVDIPPLISYVCANALAFTAYRYFNYSLINLAGDQPNLKPALLRSAIIFGLYALCLHVIGVMLNSGYQTIFVSLFVLFISAQGGYLSLKVYRKNKIDLIKIYAIIFFLSAAFWLARIFLVFLDIAIVAFDANLFNTIIFVSVFLLGIFRYMIFPIFLLKIAENDKEKLLIDHLMWANKTAETGALSASIAHELHQPLGAIQINSEFMKLQLSTGTVDEALLKELAQRIVSDNLRAGAIIQSLRSIFSSEATASDPIDIGEIVQSVLKITGPELSRKNIQVKLHLLSPTISRVNAPEIQQVVLNLLNNAIQALSKTLHEPKEITIETRREGDKNILTIADNGKGVPKERQAKLFELASDSQHNGMGLGLWLCKQIVLRNSGAISYMDNPAGGARFSVNLPRLMA